MKYTKPILFASVLTFLGACSNGTASPPSTVPPDVSAIGFITTPFTPTYDSVADSVTLSDGAGTDFVYASSGAYLNGRVRGFTRAATDHTDLVMYGETTSGSGTAFVLNSTEPGFAAAQIYVARSGSSDIPTSGTATYSGDYSAFLYNLDDPDPVGVYYLEGDVSIAADFGAATVSGLVTNRAGTGSRTYADLTLESTTIENGAFTASSSGGELTSGTLSTTSTGIYDGMFTGATGGEVVGAVIIEHAETGPDMYEAGVFVAQ